MLRLLADPGLKPSGGAGCELKADRALTVLEGKVVGRQLKLIVHDLTSGSILGEYDFKPAAST